MKTNLYRLLSLITILYSITVTGQTYNLNNYLTMPAVVPSSPNAASIERFGNIPVDYSTGVPSIEIPVWSIKCGTINWPMAFSYHGSGIKVDEIASPVGLGWALTGQGVISRSVLGKPDEQWTGNPLYTSVTYNDYNYLYAVRNGQNDAEPDIFSYNFNGRSGKFLIKQDGNIFMMPYANLKITNNSFNSFTILDENGTTYIFDQKETANVDANGSLSTYTSSWYLSKVQPLNKSQSIDFVYGDVGNCSQSFYNFSQSIGVRPLYINENCGAPEYAESYSAPTFGRTNITTATIQLTQINFPNGYISLTYTHDRSDIAGIGKGRITDISIYQLATPKLIKKFLLQQSYFFYRPPGITADDPTQYRLKLDEVDDISGDVSLKKPYKFNYNATPIMPRGNYGQDKWGFNNGHYENTSLIQTQTVNYVNGNVYNIGSANRTTDVNQMQACMLNTVTYPTGGKTEYTFEPHQYQTNYQLSTLSTVNAYAVGTSPQSAATTFTFPASNAVNSRIKVNLSKYNFPGVTDRPYVKLTDLTSNTIVYNLSNFTPDNLVSTDNSFFLTAGHNYKAEAFVYTTVSNTQLEARITIQWDVLSGTYATESGGGLRIKEIKNYTNSATVAEDYIYEYPLATPLTPFSYIDKTFNDIVYSFGSHACFLGASCAQTTSGPCRIYHSASEYPASTVAGSPVLYNKVTKYSKDLSGIDIGKTEYNYDVIQDAEVPVGGPSLFNAHLFTNDWKNGFLSSELNYKKSGTVYQIINKTENEYAEYKSGTAYSLKVYPNYIQGGCEEQGSTYVSNAINFFALPIYTGSKKLHKSTVTNIDDAGNQIATTTINEYTESDNDFVTKTTVTDSKQIDKTTTFKYPVDFVVTGNVFDKMIQQHFTSPIIEQQSLSGTTILSTMHKTFRDWKNDSKVLAPEILQQSLFTNPLENRLQYYNYDVAGNPLSVSKVNDAVQSYIYDYQNSYPVAEIKNAGTGDVAYTSFEGDGKGNWAYLGNPVVDPTALTGKKIYDPANGSVSKLINTAGTYVISYWSKNGSKSITGTTITQGRTVNDWTYYENKGAFTSGFNIIISASGVLDELRLYPAEAKMTSYTYDPLIGQTSMADASGELVYYEYDPYNRLKNIKDYQGNIVKNFQYNYANSCGPNCVVLPMQTYSGSNTIGYPVGVFNVNAQLLGQATTQAQYLSLWNANAANQAKGVLSAGVDGLHFNLALATGQTAPSAVMGLRYYQVDLDYTSLDAIARKNGEFVDFNDGIVLRLGSSFNPTALPANTTALGADPYIHIIHTYPNSNLKTLTIYHNDGMEYFDFDNYYNPATTLTKLKNLRGNIPQFTQRLGGSSYQQATMNTIGNITNWNTISTITSFSTNTGDQVTPWQNLNFTQDFMANNKGLQSIITHQYVPYACGYRDVSFKISRLKSDWNTYFTELNYIAINEDHWNHESLSSLKKLSFFMLNATTQDHTNNHTSNPLIPLSTSVIDNVFIQIASGAGNAGIRNGTIAIRSGGSARTSLSDAAYNQLAAAGWLLIVDQGAY